MPYHIRIEDESPLYGGEANRAKHLGDVDVSGDPEIAIAVVDALRAKFPARSTRITVEEIKVERRVLMRQSGGGVGPNPSWNDVGEPLIRHPF